MAQIGLDEVFPLYAQSTPDVGGLSWNSVQIGKVFVASGLVLALCLLILFPPLIKLLGMTAWQRLGWLVSIPCFIAIPAAKTLSWNYPSLFTAATVANTGVAVGLAAAKLTLSVGSTTLVTSDMRGKLGGLYNMFENVGRFLGPAGFATTYAWSVSPSAPGLVNFRFVFFAAAAILAAGTILAWGTMTTENLTRNDEGKGEQGDDDLLRPDVVLLDTSSTGSKTTTSSAIDSRDENQEKVGVDLLPEVLALAAKGKLHITDDDITVLVRDPDVHALRNATTVSSRLDSPIRVYVPMAMRHWALDTCQAVASYHLGTSRTLRMLERFFWWIGMDACVRFWLRRCLVCQARKTSRQTVRWPVLSLPLPNSPGVLVSYDYFGPLPLTPRGNRYILLFTDRFSRRADMFPVTQAQFTAEGTADILVHQYIPLWGCPVSLLSDNAKHFSSKLPDAIHKRLGINEVHTSAYHPESNGGTERANHTMAQMLSVVVNEPQTDWDLQLPHVEAAYNNSENAATGLTPNDVHIGRTPRLPLSLFTSPNIGGHQSLDRDHLAYCDLATERQRRAYTIVRDHYAITASRLESRNSKLLAAFKRPLYEVGGWVWVYNSAATIRQGARRDTDDKVLKEKLSLLYTGPFKILAVGPAAPEDTPDHRPLHDKLLFLDLPSDMPGSDAKPRVSVARCKPCHNPTDTSEVPKYLPADLSLYALNSFAKKSPPYHVTTADVFSQPTRLDVEQLTAHQVARGRGGNLAVMYETHWKELLTPSWERESDLQHFRPKILQYWSGAPAQRRQTNRLYRQMRVGSAQREIARSKGERFLAEGYALVPHHLWTRRFRVSTLPTGAYFWYKSSDNLWWLGKISRSVDASPSTPAADRYIVRFLDDPGPIALTLSPTLYSIALGAPSGSWCLQCHRQPGATRGVLRNADTSRGAPTTT
eukprot:g4353.t1